MGWPNVLRKILERYYNLQTAGGGILTPQQRRDFVNEMIETYDGLGYGEKVDVLVPGDSSFIAKKDAIVSDIVGDTEAEYAIMYRWPANDGFASVPTHITLQCGKQYDRLGNSHGKFIAPLSPNGNPQSFLSRAIPYHVSETDIRENPAYHLYTVKKSYGNSKRVVKEGKVAQAFWPSDGGGTQVFLPRRIRYLGDVLDEITKKQKAVAGTSGKK